MNDGVRIAEALAKPVAEIDRCDVLAGRGVHEAQLVDIDRDRARRLADAEIVEGVKSIGAELDSGADLAQRRCLLEHGDALSRARQGERRREPANAAAGNQEMLLGSLSRSTTHRRLLSRLYAALMSRCGARDVSLLRLTSSAKSCISRRWSVPPSGSSMRSCARSTAGAAAASVFLPSAVR